MPIILKKIVAPGVTLGIWHLVEEESFFHDHLNLSEEEKESLYIIKGDRRTQWLGARLLLHHLTASEERIACVKDDHGKPFLQGSTHHIGFSHSEHLVAVITGDMAVGVDIQLQVDKILRIQHKFISENEANLLKELDPIKSAHIVWGAKESAYKAYGRKKVDYLKHMSLDQYQNNNLELTLEKDEEKLIFTGKVEQWQDFTLVYLWQTH